MDKYNNIEKKKKETIRAHLAAIQNIVKKTLKKI